MSRTNNSHIVNWGLRIRLKILTWHCMFPSIQKILFVEAVVILAFLLTPLLNAYRPDLIDRVDTVISKSLV